MADNEPGTEELNAEEIPVDEGQPLEGEVESSESPVDQVDENIASLEEDLDDLPVDSRDNVSEYTLPLLPNDPKYSVDGDDFDESALNELLNAKESKESTPKEASKPDTEEYVSFGQAEATSNEFSQDGDEEEEEEVREEEEDEDMALMDPDNVLFKLN